MVCGAEVWGSVLREDWATELWEFAKAERRPLFLWCICKMAEVGNRAVR